MKYTLMSVSDVRAEKKKSIRARLSRWEEVNMEFVDWRSAQQVQEAIREFQIKFHRPNMRHGQRAFLLSAFRALSVAPGFVIEDDAILVPGFASKAERFIQKCPENIDFAALMIPLDHLDKFQPPDYLGNGICRIYQPGATAVTYYSERGAQKIRDLFDRDGSIAQYDVQIFNYARGGELNGYTTHPSQEKLATITDGEPSQIQNTEIIK